MKQLYRLLLAGIIFLGPSCDDENAGDFKGIFFSRPPRELRDGQGFFELWLGFPNGTGGKDWISIMKFDNVESTNRPFLNGTVPQVTLPDRDVMEAVSAAISIELENDPDPSTPNRIFMSGDFAAGVAVLDLRGEDAIGLDLTDTSTISGRFVLATPTDTISTNEESGVWFVDTPFGMGPQGPGLKLPALPSGFRFEAWVATFSETVCISTGTFTSASGTDSNGAGPNAGPMTPPAFPGEDLYFDAFNEDVQGRDVDASIQQAYLDTFAFPINIRRLIGMNPITGTDDRWDVVVSIEPVPDNDPYEPFAIFPLVKFGPIFESANTVVRMDNFALGTSQQVVINLEKLK